MSWSRKFRLRELARTLEEVRAKGLSAPDALPVEVAALAKFVDEIVGSNPGTGTSTRLVSALARIQDRANSIAARDVPGIACREGCSHCCKLFVSATPPHIFAVADYFRRHRNPGELEGLRLREQRTRGLDVAGRSKGLAACAFLENDRCSAYDVRPLSCRSYFSMDVEKCLASFGENAPNIPMPAFGSNYRWVFDQAVWAILTARGLPRRGYELGHAVVVALDDPTAEDRWYQGDDVFHAVYVDPNWAQLEQGFGPSWAALNALAQGLPSPPAAPFNKSLPKWCL